MRTLVKFINPSLLFIKLALLSQLFILVACAPKPVENSNGSNKSLPLQGQMQALSHTLTDLIPLISDAAKFNDPKNQEKIMQRAQALTQLSHAVKADSKSVGQDPTVEFILNQFLEDTQRAVDALKSGHRAYAQHLLRNTTSYCVQCHTRTANGPAFIGNSLDKTLAQLSPLEKGEVLAATRQFEQALAEFQKIIDSPRQNQTNIFVWDKAVRYALTIAVRFMDNPTLAMQIVDSILKNEHTPYYLRQSATVWKVHIKEWIREPRIVTKKPGTLIAKAQSLIKKSQERNDFERTEQIYYLRAASLLHQALELSQDREEKSQALLLIGECYETFRDVAIWSLDERYYEACIRINPRSSTSEQCYQKYEENVFMGYSGSQGTTLPPEIQQKLAELKVMAKKEVK